MLTKPIALVGLAAVMLAAGAGSYLAVRQNGAPLHREVVENAGAIGTAQATAAPESLAVDATEALVGDQEPTGAEVAAPEILTSAPTTPAARAATPPPANPTPARPRLDSRRTERGPSPSPPASDDAPANARVARASTADRSEAPPSRAPRTDIGATDPAAPAAAREDTTIESDPQPARSSPVERAPAGLPAVEGWSRAEGDTPAGSDTPAPISAGPLVGDRTPEIAPTPVLAEYEIAADSVIGLQVETAVSTRTAVVEDPIEARVTRDVLVADQVAVPAGTRMLGSVVLVEQAGKLRDAARLGVRFHTLVMDEGPSVQIVTETIYREGAPKGRDSVAKIGGAAVGGAILGAIFGGARGAAVGGSIGAGGGAAAAVTSEAEPAGLPPGTMLTVRLSRPAIVTVEQ